MDIEKKLKEITTHLKETDGKKDNKGFIGVFASGDGRYTTNVYGQGLILVALIVNLLRSDKDFKTILQAAIAYVDDEAKNK